MSPRNDEAAPKGGSLTTTTPASDGIKRHATPRHSATSDYFEGRQRVYGRRASLSAVAPVAHEQQVEALGPVDARRWGLDYLAEAGGVLPTHLVVELARIPLLAREATIASRETAESFLVAIERTVADVVAQVHGGAR